MKDNNKGITIMFKPTSNIIVGAIIGLLFVMSALYIQYFWILGLLLLVLVLFIQIQIKDFKVCTFYEDYFIVYDKKDLSYENKIDYKDIDEWKLLNASNEGNGIIIRLKDQSIVYLETVNPSKARKCLMKYVKELESNKKFVDSIGNTPLTLEAFKSKKNKRGK